MAVVLGPALALGQPLEAWEPVSAQPPLLQAVAPSPLVPTQTSLSVCAETQGGPGNAGRESEFDEKGVGYSFTHGGWRKETLTCLWNFPLDAVLLSKTSWVFSPYTLL